MGHSVVSFPNVKNIVLITIIWGARGLPKAHTEFEVFNFHFEDPLDCSTMFPLAAFNSSPLLGIQQFENGKQQRKVPGSDNVSSGSTCEQPGAHRGCREWPLQAVTAGRTRQRRNYLIIFLSNTNSTCTGVWEFPGAQLSFEIRRWRGTRTNSPAVLPVL